MGLVESVLLSEYCCLQALSSCAHARNFFIMDILPSPTRFPTGLPRAYRIEIAVCRLRRTELFFTPTILLALTGGFMPVSLSTALKTTLSIDSLAC